ncbi:MAG: hypothetical protein GY936_01720, partial [Ignavibacteriae bacterium]|nr:hypothetical protein [Ignavibacteriota bacterium]
MKKQIRKLLLFFVFLLTSLFMLNFSSCDTTDPPPPTKSPRNYTWSVDTLDLPITFQISMRSIWGSSENDIYTCGHVSGSLGDLWHYDGKQWEVVDYSKDWEGRGFLQRVHGTSDDNVWVVGSTPWQDTHSNKIEIPYVIQFDGTKWIRHEIDTENRAEGLLVLSKTDVWACGEGGLVYHYDGNSWDIDTLVNPVNKDFIF